MKAIGARPGLKGTAALSLIVLCGTSVLNLGSAWAQTADEPTVQQLQKEIKTRDALIENLLRRVENLERRVGSTAATNHAAPVVAQQSLSPSPRPSQVAAAPAEAAPSLTAEAAPSSTAGPPPGPPAAPTQQPPGQQQTTTSAPGQFEVNPQAAERALERTLTATGALLVPNGFAEVEPAIGYDRREIPNLVLFTDNRNEFSAATTVRLGLPWESQIDIGVPYEVVQHQLVDNFVAPARLVTSATGNSFGDVTVGVSKTLLHERGWLPDLIGRISYEIPTGPVISNTVALPASGQSRLSFSFTALKRQDPLAFVAAVAYSKAFEHEDINPGDQLTFSGGVFLATSPATTLRAVLQQSFVQAPTINDVTIKGGNTVESILTFGASSILGRGLPLLDLQVGVGLTRDAPKYDVIVSLPIRFGVPGL